MLEEKPVVLQLIKGLDVGGVNGGAERFSIDLSKHLKKSGYKIIICAFFQMDTDLEKIWLDKITEMGITVIHASTWKGNNNFKSYLNGIRTLSEFLNKNPVQIIHSHFQLGTIAGIYLKQKCNIPVVLRTAHNVIEWEKNFYGWIRKVLFSNWIYPIFLNAEVGVSKAIINQLSDHPGVKLNPGKTKLIYNGINLKNSTRKIVVRTVDKNDFIVGSVGRLAEQKGYIYLIRAIPLIINKNPNVQFIIIGGGELKDFLYAEAQKLNVLDHLQLKGQIENVYDYLCQFDVFVSTSLWEGLPTTILEAATAGVPIIATAIPGNKEFIIDEVNGWLVPAADSKALAEKIIRSMNSPDLRKNFRNAAAEKVNQFSINEVAEQYNQLYKQLLGKSKNEK